MSGTAAASDPGAGGAAAGGTPGDGATALGGATAAASAAAAANDPGQAAAAAQGASAGAAAPTWPGDWRKQVMGEEADKRGDRFTAPSDVWKAYRALETKLSSGEYKPIVAKPANDAAPEDVAAYRKSIGAPEKAEGYLENLPKGLVVDADAPLLNKFVERMHASHAPTELVQTAIQSYFDVQQAVNADLVEQDQSAQQRVTDDLYGEWGNETRANLNAVGGFLRTTFGNELAEQIEHARLADGTKLGNSKETIEAFLRIAKDMNPAATIVPGVGGSSAQGIEQRLGELRKMQAENPKAYWNNDKVQDEERQLIEAQQRMNARSA